MADRLLVLATDLMVAHRWASERGLSCQEWEFVTGVHRVQGLPWGGRYALVVAATQLPERSAELVQIEAALRMRGWQPIDNVRSSQ